MRASRTGASTPVGSSAMPVQTVWSPWLRALHWVLAVSMIASFVTHEGAGTVHEVLGYVALAAACVRVLLGFAGAGYWPFRQFVRSPAATLAYTRDLLAHREKRYLGHNPLGGWMVLVLLTDVIACGLTGWMSTTDRFFGVAWVGNLHDAVGHALIPLLLLHLAGVVFTSWRHRENLVAAMLHGKKRALAENAVPMPARQLQTRK
jgi:cytochrome b